MLGYAYDAAGNLLSDGYNVMTWDAESRIATVAGDTYIYDAEGNRVEEQGAGVTDRIYFGGRPIARLTAGQWTDLIYGPTGLLAEVPGTQTATPVYRMTDHLGNVVGNLPADGSYVNPLDYRPFGGVFSGSTADPYMFTGKERDAESGLDYFGARYYSSSMGRMMSPDPAGVRAVKLANPQTWNWYAYVQNNPLRFTDPTGMYTCADDHNKCATDKDKAFETSRQNDLGSKDKGVAAAAKAYGDPTKDNHVAVGFTDAKSGHTSISFNVKNGVVSSQINVLIPNGATGTALDGVVDHEGTHVEQGQALLGSVTAKGTFNTTLNLSSYSRELPGVPKSSDGLAAVRPIVVNERQWPICDHSWRQPKPSQSDYQSIFGRPSERLQRRYSTKPR